MNTRGNGRINMSELSEVFYPTTQQETRYVTKEELARLQKEQAFEHECNMKAASACQLLRQQLRDQEMNDLLKRIYTSNPPQKEDFVFVSRRELIDELDKRVKSITQ